MTFVDITTLSPRSSCTPALGSGTTISLGPVGTPDGSVGAARRIETAPPMVLLGLDSLQPDRPSDTADATVTKSLSRRPTADMKIFPDRGVLAGDGPARCSRAPLRWLQRLYHRLPAVWRATGTRWSTSVRGRSKASRSGSGRPPGDDPDRTEQATSAVARSVGSEPRSVMPILGIGAPGRIALGVALVPGLAVVSARAGDARRDACFELLELQLQLLHVGHLLSSWNHPAPRSHPFAAVTTRTRGGDRHEGAEAAAR